MRPRARDTLVLVLIVATVISSVYSANISTNYAQFYPALSKLKLTLTDLTWEANPSSLNAAAVFTIENPSQYSGAVMRSFQSVLVIVLNGTIRLSQGSLQSSQPEFPLTPGSGTNITIFFPGTLDTPFRVSDTVAKGGTVEFDFSVKVVIATYLSQVATIVDNYECTGTTGRGTCSDAATVIAGASDGGGPGGGT